MNRFVFYVQGSADEPYKVQFIKDGVNLSAYCTCPAGDNGQYCKHRIKILEGKTEGIVSDNINDVQTVVSWLKGTDVEKALCNFHEAEKLEEEAKKKFAKAKKELAAALRD